MKFEDLIRVIDRNKTIKENSGITSILSPFERLSQVYGGFTKSSITCITASSGVGKTKFVKFLTIDNVIRKTHGTHIKPKIFYFALEENATDFWLSFICSYLYKKHKLNISVTQLKSIGSFTVKTVCPPKALWLLVTILTVLLMNFFAIEFQLNFYFLG